MDAAQQRGAGLSFRIDPETRVLIATIVPDAAAQPIDEPWLREALAESGFGALRYLPTAGTALLAQYNTGTAAEIKLAECVDARIQITLTPDGLEARLDIEPPQGGLPATQERVLLALAEHGIDKSILLDVIDTAIERGAAEGMVVARGRPAVNGRDGRLESLLPEARSRVPKVDESGHTDFRDLGEILVVHPGDLLMRRHAPTEGTPGLTLRGDTIPAKPGKAVAYAPNLPGTTFAPDNPDLLLSAIAGQPVLVRGGMMVEPLFTANDVDTASGNIDFEGSVVILGEVHAGMIVKASGDIEVRGLVEMATLEAGGSINIKGGALGALGHKNAGQQHHIRCGGSFNATYAQQAIIEAGDSIFIDDMAMQCELTAINHIRVGNQRRGHIIGGTAKATVSITANVIGSPNRVRTVFEIGVNPLMHKQLLAMAKDRDAKENQLLEISKLLDFAQHHPGKIRPDMIAKARATAAALSAEIAALREEQDVMTKKIELSQQSRVIAEQAAYEGVEVHMGNLRYRLNAEQGPCAIGLGKDGLGLLPLEHAPE